MDNVDRAKIREMGQRKAAVQAALNSKSKRKQMLINDVPHCIDCHEEIPKERLDALPDAARCVDCEELTERRMR